VTTRDASAEFPRHLEENMSALLASQRLGVHENTITNGICAAQERCRSRSSGARPGALPEPIERRSPELLVALRVIRSCTTRSRS
jgi:hypothetical protein